MKAYKKRMIKEYNQLNKRIKKLEKIIIKAEADTLEFDLITPLHLLREQLEDMKHYRHILLLRAEYEDIELEY
jgi:hypothetical protein